MARGGTSSRLQRMERKCHVFWVRAPVRRTAPAAAWRGRPGTRPRECPAAGRTRPCAGGPAARPPAACHHALLRVSAPARACWLCTRRHEATNCLMCAHLCGQKLASAECHRKNSCTHFLCTGLPTLLQYTLHRPSAQETRKAQHESWLAPLEVFYTLGCLTDALIRIHAGTAQHQRCKCARPNSNA